MKTLKKFSVILLALSVLLAEGFLFVTVAQAADAEKAVKPLVGRHRIELGFGLLSDVENDIGVLPGVVTNDVSVDGAAFNLGYTYWPRENWNFSFKLAVLGANVNQNYAVGLMSTETSSVVPLIFSVGYQPAKLAISEGIRPFFTLGVGPILGVRTKNITSLTIANETSTESAFGAHFGAGIDFIMTRLLSLSLRGGYYLVSDFDIPVGGNDNYSTPEFSLCLGFNFGKGK